ncbi:WD40 repeat domain-containing protein [Streptomyces sp. Je 1-369]|uniref:WD40 repeat domain-containing protein n=1 Tax=Streptomyces sp. Je 1-369 TaxID=2966192 RepID=UPI0022860F02|nr:WD40 repeat domain-containing protein [Streptomyces sp. Je 1-369]WAL96200.1 WD40 repeat domain-containing protein [Streptomyces sp. Je 1-369]
MRSLRAFPCAPSVPSVLAGIGAALVLTVAAAVPAAADDHDGFTIEDPRIVESSGLAASRAHPGVYWTHNDQDKGAFLYAVDSKTGKTVATVTMTGVGAPRDVEAISVGGDGNIYVGDIGDNLNGTWSNVWVYKLPEPKTLKDQTVRATQYVVKYADGARDAEALMVHPKTGRIYIVSKNEDGGGLYEGPERMSASSTNVFKRISEIDLWVTDGAFSPDGEQLAVRGYFGGIRYAWQGAGRKPQRKGRLSVPLQRQGESVTYTLDGTTLMYGTEGEQSEVKPVEAPGGGSGGDSDGSSGGGAGSGDGGGDSGAEGGLKTGAIVVGAVLLAVFGWKRLGRRGGRHG